MEPGTPEGTTRLRFAAVCGMAAPLTFFGTVLLLGYLLPEYRHTTQLMSGLGVVGSPYAAASHQYG